MRRENFQCVTPEYVSNCLIEAVKAKLKDPRRVKLYFCKPNKRRMFHFMWSDGAADYDFSDAYCENEKFCVRPLFRGRIRRFKLGFAARYCALRNKGAIP